MKKMILVVSIGIVENESGRQINISDLKYLIWLDGYVLPASNKLLVIVEGDIDVPRTYLQEQRYLQNLLYKSGRKDIDKSKIGNLRRLLSESLCINNKEDFDETLSFLDEYKKVAFLSNIAGDFTNRIIDNLSYDKLIPLIVKKRPRTVEHLEYPIDYFKVRDIVKDAKKQCARRGKISVNSIFLLDNFDENFSLRLLELDTNDAIFLQGNDRYLTEYIIKILVRDYQRVMLFDMEYGLPFIDEEADAFVFVNFNWSPKPQYLSSYWIKLKTLYNRKKKIIIAVNDYLNAEKFPDWFTQLRLPSTQTLAENQLKILATLINLRTSKLQICEIPKYLNESPLNDLLAKVQNAYYAKVRQTKELCSGNWPNIPEIKIEKIEYALSRINLDDFKDFLFSADFWYVFMLALAYGIPNEKYKWKHNFPSYLRPLPDSELRAGELTGRVLIIRTTNGRPPYNLEPASASAIKVKKSVALEHIITLITRSVTYPHFLKFEEFTSESGKSLNSKQAKNTFQKAFNYFFEEKSPELHDWKECIVINDEGCSYRPINGKKIFIDPGKP